MHGELAALDAGPGGEGKGEQGGDDSAALRVPVWLRAGRRVEGTWLRRGRDDRNMLEGRRQAGPHGSEWLAQLRLVTSWGGGAWAESHMAPFR